jgi:hypothetical protein
MGSLRRVIDFYLNASVHVALSVVSLYYITTVFFDFPFDANLGVFIGMSTLITYNFIKYGVEAHKYLFVSIKYHKYIQVFSAVAGIILLIFFPALSWATVAWLAGMVFLTLLYALPMLPGRKNLRSFGILKILLVALIWSIVTVLVPVVQQNVVINWDVKIEAVQRFLLVLAMMVPFEIRDLAYDPPSLRTLPQRWGIYHSKLWGLGWLLIFSVLTFLKDEYVPLEMLTKIMLTVVLGLMILRTKKENRRYFTAFWVEGIPIFWAFLLFLR